MRDFVSKLMFIITDMLMIVLSISFASHFRNQLDDFLSKTHNIHLSTYTEFYPLYIIPILLFAYEGIYTYRYDFWHESRLILKGIFFSGLLIFAYLGATKLIGEYSRVVITFTLIFMSIFIPISKNILKKLLFKLKIWQKSATIYGDDKFLIDEIYGNPYLGYIKATKSEEASTVFINSKDNNVKSLKSIISAEIKERSEVIFIPLVDEYNLTHSHIYELSNTRTNLIVFQNRLRSSYRLVLKRVTDMILSISIFPFLVVPMLYISYRIKREEPNESIFFTQERVGAEKSIFICYKFRTMYKDGDIILDEYLKSNPDEIEYYNKFHKYKNDPRITKIGKLLRRTSLDELPQIFNVFRQEMSFIGPRPYMLSEESSINDGLDVIVSVKPGITGLWQVSGRSNVDFDSRVKLDIWYIQNWNLWMDFMIFIKTIKTVIFSEGAK
jgi:undecaprenyl-phosphate galactose phosphotransferase